MGEGAKEPDGPCPDAAARTSHPAILRIDLTRPNSPWFWLLAHVQAMRLLLIVVVLAMMLEIILL